MSTTRDIDPLDVRIVERNIRRGVVSRKDHAKHIKNLPDVANKAHTIDERQPLEPEEADSE